ncbi:MAG TPA: hypothetical protein ENK02_16155 [Planctomycetes bacterium]|nr:hypothetical protein [Planctomycetota bacterium]
MKKDMERMNLQEELGFLRRGMGLFAFLAMASILPAQRELGTLEHLSRKAGYVLVTKVSRSWIEGERRFVRFQVRDKLKGRFGDNLVLSEAAPMGNKEQRYCGSGIAFLSRQKTYLLFLAGSEQDPRLLAGGRSIVEDSPSRRAAVAALLRTKDPRGRARILVSQLGAQDRRIAEDAALALPILPGLERSDPGTQGILRASLENRLRSNKRDLITFALLRAMARLDPQRAAGSAWRLALDPKSGALGDYSRFLLRRSLPIAATLRSLPRPRDAATRAQVIDLLAATRNKAVIPALLSLAKQAAPKERVKTSAILLGLGLRERDLPKGLSPDQKLEAKQLSKLWDKPRFRSIRR